jgi:hypothetical protein
MWAKIQAYADLCRILSNSPGHLNWFRAGEAGALKPAGFSTWPGILLATGVFSPSALQKMPRAWIILPSQEIPLLLQKKTDRLTIPEK